MNASRADFLREHLSDHAAGDSREDPRPLDDSANALFVQADALRSKARAVFARQHAGPSGAPNEERLIARLPYGVGKVIAVSWARQRIGEPWQLGLRVYRADPGGGWLPMRGAGMIVPTGLVPGLAAALSTALDDLEPSEYGLRVKDSPALHAGEDPRDSRDAAATDRRNGHGGRR